MTKNEFNEFINSFNKTKGEYTKDEIYEIGKKHKELALGDRDWRALADRLGVDYGETLRSFVKSRQYQDGILEKNTHNLGDTTIDELTEEQVSDKVESQIQDLYIQQTKTRDERNAFRRTLRDEARIQNFKDTIKTYVNTLEPFEKISFNDIVSDRNTEACLLLSDMHIGVDCDNFYNKYNSEIAQKRITKLIKEVCKYAKRNNVKRLNVINLGDLIHGHIHINARVEQEFGVIDQIMKASEIVSFLLNELQKCVPEVVYRSCTDNHSRLMVNKEEHIEKDNLNKLIDWYVEERLTFSNVQFPKDNIDDSIGLFKLLNGKTVAFVHGHLDKKTSVIQDLSGAIRQYIDYIMMGHFHSSSARSFQNSKVYINGSIVGTEDFALSHRLFNEPSQKLVIFEDDNELDIDIGLN